MFSWRKAFIRRWGKINKQKISKAQTTVSYIIYVIAMILGLDLRCCERMELNHHVLNTAVFT